MEESIFSVEEVNDVTLVRLIEKKLYQNVVTPFQTGMIALLDKGTRKLVIDLSEVDVMNSSGLGVLILTWDRLNKEGGKLIVTGLCSLMEELFERMRLDLLFTLAKTNEEAFEMMKGT